MFPSQRAASRRAFILMVTLLAAGIFVLFGRAQGPGGQPQHVIVKINSSLAKDVESALPMQTMELLAGSSGNARVEAFLSKYAARMLRPVYPNIVRSKKNGLTDLQIATAIQQKFAKRASRLHASFRPPEISRTYVLEFDPAAKPNLQAALKSLSADADVEFAEQDHLASTNFTPNDPYFSSYGSWGQAYDDLWGIKKIGAPAAWDSTAGAGIVVAVVDTGIDFTHPDMAANIWTNPNPGSDGYPNDVHGWDFIGSTYTNPVQSNNPVDHFGHGTHVSGTIAAVGNNGIGVIGVAWNAQVMPVKGLDDSGFGLDSTLGPAITYAANNGADVISNSWAGQGTSQTISQAIDYAHSLGAVIVAAAGNNSDDARNYFPANSWDAITVAATDHNDFAASFSNYGSKIDVAAPGVDILSLRAAGTSMGTPVDAYYTRADGTSMATPHVSGLAALILAQNPAFSNEDVRQALRHTATIPVTNNGFDVNYGYGRINAATAISLPGVLESKISSPADGTVVTAQTVISGYARGTGFASYVLQYGSGTNPSSWTTIQTGTSPAAGTALGTFDPTVIPDGVYTIRLTAYDLSNNAYVDHVQLTVKYVSITAPVAPIVPNVAAEFKPGSPFSITGTASGPSFNDFRLEWAEGINPSSGWSSTGMSLTNGGTSPVSNAIVGTWDTSSITTADFYTIRLFVDNAAFTSDASTLVYLEPSLLSSSWPISLNQAPNFGSGIVPARDASNNIRLTLVNPVYGNTTLPAQFWSISPDGATQKVTQIYYGDQLQPAAGNFDGQPGEDALVSESNDILVFRPDNSSFVLTPPISSNLQYAGIVLEDLNNDSNLEAIALGHNPFSPVAYVYAWQSNGAQLNNNFPITVPDQNSNLWYPQGQRVLVGDVNGDGYKEIVVEEGVSSSSFALGLFAHDGTQLNWSAPTLAGTADHIALADLDHNGKLEIIIIVDTGSQKVVHVLQPDGTERAGWPLTLPYYGFTSIAVANLNRDGRDQIVISSSASISVLNPDGTSLSTAWPLLATGLTSFGPAVLADINGDGRPEILFAKSSSASAPSPLLSSVASSSSTQSATANSAAPVGPPQITSEQQLSSDGTGVTESIHVQSSAQSFYGGYPYEDMKLVALRSDGSLANSWRVLGVAGNQPFFWAVPTVGDFNGDGLVDIGLTYFTISGGGVSGWLNAGGATVLTPGTPFNAAANDWPMVSQNPRNTAVYRPLLNVSVASPTSGASVSGVVTISANPADKVATPTVQFQIDGANFGSPVAAAPYSVAWDTTTASLGSHVITASASDSSSNTAVSPPVSVTVTLPPAIFASPSSLNFGSAIIGSATAAQTITISNPAQTAYTLSAVNVTGDFAQTSNCIGSLAAGGSCSINVTFTPSVRGSETGALTLSGNFPGPSPTVALSGTGQALTASFSPASLTFQPLAIGSTSPAQVLTYSNTGDFAVSISSIMATGDFAETNNCGASLATGASCSITVTFTPTARGTRAGTIAVSGNVNASATLTGTGQAMLASISPTTLSFGNQAVSTTSAPQTVTVSNTGDFAFYINGWSYGSPYNVVFNGPGYVQPGSAATFTVTFAPTSYGNYPVNFTINGSFPGAPVTIPMSGTGQDTAGLLLPASVTFPNQIVGTSSNVQAVDIINTANLPLTISSIQTTGDFTQTNNCGATLAPSYSCVISITFHPTTTGTRTGSVSVTTNARVPVAPSSLSGTGVTPLLSFSPAAFSNFGNQRVNTTSAPQAINISNTGTAPLTITSFTVTPGFNQVNTCGSTLAVNSSCSVSVTFSPTAQGAITGTLTLNSNAPGSPSSFSLAGTGTASVAALSPNSLTFASQLVGTASSAQPVMLTNTGTAPLDISSITANTDFTQSNNCPGSLAAGANCTINVTFTPAASGARSGTLSISDDALAGSPQTVALSGAGYTLSAAFSPTSSTFASQRVGTTSGAQNVTLTSSGSGTLSISGFAVSGDFSQSNNCPASLTSGASCTVSIVFVPTARGTRSGTLTLNSNAPGAAPSVALGGTGTASIATLTPSSLAFANQFVGTTSAAQTIVLANTGDSTLNVSSIAAGGDFAQSNTCGAALAPNANCNINVTFTPSVSGSRSGTLSVTDDALGGSPQTASLSGTGTAPALSFSPPTFSSFGNQRVHTTSAAQSVTMTNTGNASLSITSITVTAGFSQTNNCGSSLASNASCSISVTFTPTAQGSVTGTLTLNSNLPGAAPSFSLNGTGTASIATLSPSSLTFASQLVGTSSSALPVTLTNTGTAPLNISSVAASGDFAQTNTCAALLAAGANCSINVTFTPSASGARSGTLSISDDALAGSPQTVTLSGTGYTLSAAFNPTSTSFASQRVGTTSSAQTVTITSTGTGTLAISGFAVSGDFAQSNNCPASLTSGASCTVSIVFAPTARGTRSGTLTLNSNAPGTPPSVSLSGTGVAPVASLSPTSLTFAAQTVSTTSSQQNVTLSNTGDATLDISSVTASGDFAQSNNCGTTLSAGAHCTLSVKFTPTAPGVRTGTLTVTDDASNGSPQATSLSGTGVDFSLSASPSSVTVTHGSSGNITVTVSALGGSYSSNVNLTCSAGLPKGANCSFSPGGIAPGSGSATSTMKISTNGSTPAGSYAITVRGTSGSDQHTTTVTLQVN